METHYRRISHLITDCSGGAALAQSIFPVLKKGQDQVDYLLVEQVAMAQPYSCPVHTDSMKEWVWTCMWTPCLFWFSSSSKLGQLHYKTYSFKMAEVEWEILNKTIPQFQSWSLWMGEVQDILTVLLHFCPQIIWLHLHCTRPTSSVLGHRCQLAWKDLHLHL